MLPPSRLSGRERQIMEFLFGNPGASVAEILRGLPDPPSYSAVRATVGILERKGNLRHVQRGRGRGMPPGERRSPAALQPGAG